MILVLAWLVPVCGLVGVGLLAHRDLARIGDSLDRLPAGVEGRLNEFWGEITDMNAGHAKAVDDRFAGLEHALGETRRSQGELARTVSWAGRWVQHWAGATAAGPR